MKKIILLIVGLSAVSLIIVLFNRNLIDDWHWRWAFFRDRAENYAVYLQKWPEGRHRIEAQLFYDERSWTEASTQNTSRSYQEYLLKLPKGKYFKIAESKLAAIYWEETKKQATILGYSQFLTVYPNSQYAPEAKRCKDALKNDDKPFLEARKVGTRQAYRNFITHFPGHRREKEARTALRKVSPKDFADLLASLFLMKLRPDFDFHLFHKM